MNGRNAVLAANIVAALIWVQQPAPIDRVRYLQGCWERRANDRVVEEQWSRPMGGTMMGTGRTVVRDSVRSYEFTRIYTRGTRLVYAAQPSGQKPAEFESTVLTDDEVVFANPQHDYPQRVIYRKGGPDSLMARTEGKINGVERDIDFIYRRVACEPVAK